MNLQTILKKIKPKIKVLRKNECSLYNLTAKIYKNKYIYISLGWCKSYLRIDDNLNYKFEYINDIPVNMSLIGGFAIYFYALQHLELLYKPLKMSNIIIKKIEDRLKTTQKSLNNNLTKALEIKKERRI